MAGVLAQYKQDFIEFLLKTGALKIGGDYVLKSKRVSPYFLNVGDFSDGNSIARIGQAYAAKLIEMRKEFDVIFGPAYKGIPLAVTVSIALAAQGRNVSYAFDRKEAKDRGEATAAERQKKIIVGRQFKDGDKVVLVDDVLTSGATKFEAVELLKSFAAVDIKALIIAMDREELSPQGSNAVTAFAEKTSVPVASVVSATEIYDYLKQKNVKGIERMASYLRVYGTREAQQNFSRASQQIIAAERSIIPSCDVPTLAEFGELIRQIDIDGVGAYKIGFELTIAEGLPLLVKQRKKDKPVFYNHQSGACDIPDTAQRFMQACKKAGADGVILSFLSGPKVAEAWIKAASNEGLDVIAECFLGHPAFLAEDGGFISFNTLREMHTMLVGIGVGKFILPAIDKEMSKEMQERVLSIRRILEELDVSVLERSAGVQEIEEITAPEVMEVSVPKILQFARALTKKPIIYDHQKTGNYPNPRFAKACKGLDGVIIFPQAGPEAERSYIYHLMDHGLNVIVGCIMTHPSYLESEGGFVIDEKAFEAYRIAAQAGVSHFVVPGNKPDMIKKVKQLVESEGVAPTFYAPGFVAQGGKIEEATKIAGSRWHAIVGRGILQAADKRKAAEEYSGKL